MPNAQNIENLEKIKADLGGAPAMWVVDYRGLSVKQLQELRRNIRETGATMKVYKNSLMSIALSDLELPNLDSILEGPSAFIFTGEDAVAAAKAVKDYAKKEQKLVIKGGVMEGEALSPAQVEAIAALPSKEQLIGQIAGLISGMARGLAVSISGVSRGLAVSIQAVSEQKPAA